MCIYNVIQTTRIVQWETLITFIIQLTLIYAKALAHAMPVN